MIGICRSGCPVDFLLKNSDMNEKIPPVYQADFGDKELQLSRCRETEQ